MQASEKRVNELRHEMDSGKSIEINLERSKTFCEAQMKELDKKYNGNKVFIKLFFSTFVHKYYLIVDLASEHQEVLAKLKNYETVLRENRFEAIELRKERDEYKNQLKLLCEKHKQHQYRETIAYAKIQDALQMVESALAEKNAALQREKEIRGEFYANSSLISILIHHFGLYTDECDQLALTIGRVMEEAGDKVEGNIDEIKSNYSQRMNKLEDIIKKVRVPY